MLNILINNYREAGKRPIYMQTKDEELENIFNHCKIKMKTIQDEVDQNKKSAHFYSRVEYINNESICIQIEEYLRENNISYAIDETVVPNTIVINLPNERTKH